MKQVLKLAVIFGALFLTVQTEAQPSPVQAFTPWLLSSSDTNKDDDARPAPASRRDETAAKAAAAPVVPVLTPQDTERIVEQLYNRQQQKAAIILPSPLERAYSRRAGEMLNQYGYDQFRGGKTDKAEKGKTEQPMPAGGVQDSFVINAGDALRVTFRGQRQDSKLYTVTSQGQLIVDDLPPVSASGRTIAALRAELQAQVDAEHNTQVFVSLDQVKQIAVLVAGQVTRPGPQALTAFGSVFDALTAAGGVDKTGSLRNIQLVHGGRARTVDLYDLLVHPAANGSFALRDGDRLVIPPIGATVAIAGGVKRPGIYELPPAASGRAARLTTQDMLSLAGGPLQPGDNRFIRHSLSGGSDTISDVTREPRAVFADGDILSVEGAKPAPVDTVTVAGAAREPGIYALGHAARLSDILRGPQSLSADTYPLLGLVRRRDAQNLAPALVGFTPLQVVRGAGDLPLQDGDRVYLFSRAQISGLQKLATDAEDNAQSEAPNERKPNAASLLDPDIKSFLRERCAFVRGAVRNEGCWPVGDGVTLDAVIAAAGGLTYEASTGTIEVQSRLSGEGLQNGGRSGMRRLVVDYATMDPAGIAIGSGDSVRVRQKFQRTEDRSVTILGEVANPGRYDLLADDHLSALIARAGGVTREAYPPGVIFSRDSERRAEALRFHQQAQELELGLAAALHTKSKNSDDNNDAIDPGRIDAAQDLIGELKHAQAVGRITVQADPDVLAAHPEEDILLEAGDRVFVPRRPLSVRVAGEVESPAALAFRKDKGPEDYILEAGGFSYSADKDRAFLLYPDGSAAPLAVSSWNHSASFVPPGATIIVPRDPKPFDFLQTARDVSQILSNLAITGIFVHDLRNGQD